MLLRPGGHVGFQFPYCSTVLVFIIKADNASEVFHVPRYIQYGYSSNLAPTLLYPCSSVAVQYHA